MRNYLGTLTILGLILLQSWISYGYDNLSAGRGQYTWMSSVYGNRYPARLAVDEQYDKTRISELSCAQSATSYSSATWRIDLGHIESIKSVQIYYRNDIPSNCDNTFRGRFAGFFVYASNTTSKENGYLCYHELHNGMNSPPPIITIPCDKHARYIIYYNERKRGTTYPSFYSKEAFVELCEVVVHGCAQTGVYGENCNILCPTNCQEKRCSIDNGVCPGCKDGYTGIKCDTACTNQHYGQECKRTCGNCLNTVPCHHVNGSCLNGCSAGWKLDKCVTPCDPGRYGLHCKEMCNVNCKVTRVCNHVTGKCDGGCKDGFKGDKCDRKCDGNMYGANCNTTCGTCIGHSQCHHINGSCLTGCDKGFKGDKCTTECEPTKFGENCRYNCSLNCVNQTCNGQTGVCIQSLHQNEKDLESSSTAPIIAGVLATVVFVIALVVVVLLLRRKRIRKDSSGEGRLKETSKLKSTDLQAASSISQNVGKNQHKTGKSTTESQKVQKLSDKTMVPAVRAAAAEDVPDNHFYQELREEGLYDRQYATCANYSVKSNIGIDNVADVIKVMSKDDFESLKAEYPEEYQNFSRVLSEHIENKNKKVYYNLQSTRLV